MANFKCLLLARSLREDIVDSRQADEKTGLMKPRAGSEWGEIYASSKKNNRRYAGL
jgi:hypothetical protein